jgi:hypothetical protein
MSLLKVQPPRFEMGEKHLNAPQPVKPQSFRRAITIRDDLSGPAALRGHAFGREKHLLAKNLEAP